MSAKLYGKIYCDEGVVREHKFATEAEAAAYVLGAQDGIEQADPDQDFLSASVDDTPAVDEEDLPPRAPRSSGCKTCDRIGTTCRGCRERITRTGR